MKPTNNHVLIELDATKEEIVGGYRKHASGLDIPVQDVANRNSWITSGTVLDVPEELRFNEYSNLEYLVPMELQKGDEIIFNYREYEDCISAGRIYDNKAFIKYSTIYCAKRGEEIIPINGYLLIEPVKKEKHALEVLEKDDETKGIIRYAGCIVEKYLHSIYDQEGDDNDGCCEVLPDKSLVAKFPSVGDFVHFNQYNSRELEYFAFMKLDRKYYVMQRRDILLIKNF